MRLRKYSLLERNLEDCHFSKNTQCILLILNLCCPVNSFQLENPLSGFGLITLSRLVFIKFFFLHLFEHLPIYIPWMQESISYPMRKSTSPENIPPIFFDREKYRVKRRTNEKSLNPEK